MTVHDLSRATAELRAALRLMPSAQTSEDARQDAVYHVTMAHLLLTNPTDGKIIGTTAHTREHCLARSRATGSRG